MDWDLTKVNGWEHLIDFFVIAAADVCAFLIAYKLVESRNEDRKVAIKSIRVIRPLLDSFHQFTLSLPDKLGPGGRHSTGLGYLEWKDTPKNLGNDIAVWEFKDSGKLHSIVREIGTLLANMPVHVTPENLADALRLKQLSFEGRTEVSRLMKKMRVKGVV